MSTVPTIRSLAATLGISRTTVSDALRSSPRVKAETAKLVWEAATAAGYRPNPLAGAVMSEIRRSRGQTFRGGLAAVDLDEADRPLAAQRFHEALVDGARKRAAELGYKLQPFLVGKQGVECSRLDTILQSRGIQGVLVMPAWQEPDLSRLDWSRYSGIYTDYNIEHPALHAVCCDHYRSITTSLERLARMGYRRPGLVLHRRQDERLQNRWEGAFLAYNRSHPTPSSIPPLILEEVAKDSFVRWFKRHQPDVVLGHNPAAIDWIESCGSPVPATTGFFCLNVTLHARICTGLDLQPRLIGARSVEMLIAQLQRNERGIPDHASTTMIPAQWVSGSTITPD